MFKELVRKEILNFQPYLPGKPISEVKRELGLRKVIKLASNENSLGTSKKVLSQLKKILPEIYRYPEGSSYLLRKKISKKLNLPQEMIIAGEGSDELIELIGKTFFNPTDEIVVSEHAFIRYKMAGDLMGSKVVAVPMKNFTHDLDAMANAVTSNTKAIFVANPNNPTGTYNTRKEVERFLSSVFSCTTTSKILIVFDEAYYEYARVEKDFPEMTDYLSEYPGLVILRTFSKIYGLAGLRIGYGICNREIVEYLDRIRPPFNVTLVAQMAAIFALDDKMQVKNSMKLVQTGKKYLYEKLKSLNMKYIPSSANFIMVDVSPCKGKEVFQKLLKKGVIVRVMDEYGFPDHIRVTIGKPEENCRFINELKQLTK